MVKSRGHWRLNLVKTCVLVLLAGSLAGCNNTGGPADSRPEAEKSPLKTSGPVAEATLQVGCWSPLVEKTPGWIFPMPHHQWPKAHQPRITVKEYAQKFIDDIKKAPKSRPVWLMLHGWQGGYRPGWDKGNVLAHIKDATKEGTPGIWPEKSVEIWIKQHKEFLNYFKAEGIPIDFIPLDHETSCQQWAGNFSADYTFRNIVLDPRWKTKEVPGTSLKGIQLFDPAKLENEKDVWVRKFKWGNVEAKAKDSNLAYRHVRVITSHLPRTILQKSFVEPTHEVYPNTIVSDYGKTYRPLAERLYTKGKEASAEDWNKLFKLNPELKFEKQLGDVASPSFYGQLFWQRYNRTKNVVDGMLAEADTLIKHAGGDGRKLIPWISLPAFVDRRTKKRIEPAEYERLMLGLVKRGVRHFILWFAKAHNTPEVDREFLDVFKKAYKLTAELDEKNKSQ